MEKTFASTTDFISNLPANIIDNILIRMPICDAVRTSVLSTKWRSSWVNLPELVFDETLFQMLEDHRILVTIYQVLLLHQGPILKFTLSIYGLDGCSELNNLISFVSSKGVEEFTLKFWWGRPYRLPSSLFSFQKLMRLNLGLCEFKPPTTFKGFSRVVCLEFCDVVITAETLASLISTCPSLEKLTVESSTSFGRLEIVAPNLKDLHFVGIFKSICFKNANHLANFSICSKVPMGEVENGGDKLDSINLFDGLHVLENLHMCSLYAKSLVTGVGQRRLSTTLTHVKCLKLSDICLGAFEEVFCTQFLLRTSPRLRKVTIEVVSTRNDTGGHILKYFGVLMGNSNVYFNQIQEVEMCHVSGRKAELHFMKLLLAKSSKLESMVVKLDPTKVSIRGLKIFKELSKCKRLSPMVKIMYKDTLENQV